jgi:indoleamine 2,3-dioxygenase
MRRIPERMSPDFYFKMFRRYIRFFEDVHYEGVDQPPVSYRGETCAQSSVIPAVVSFSKIPHEPSALTVVQVQINALILPAQNSL